MSRTSDLTMDAVVAGLPGVWCYSYRVCGGTGWCYRVCGGLLTAGVTGCVVGLAGVKGVWWDWLVLQGVW